MLKVKNWSRYQHYRDRCPPWIKLATDTFQNYEFSRLADASKLLALCIWTLAARSKDGEVPDDFEYLKGLGRLGDTVKQKHLDELISQGFLERSEALAGCLQSACSEGEGEGEERESAEVASDSTQAVLIFPCVGGGSDQKEFVMTQAMVEAWADAWPGIDVLAEAKKAKVWLEANPTKKKTHKGMPAFLTRWCGRAQDTRGGKNVAPGASGSVWRPSQKPAPVQTDIERELAEKRRAGPLSVKYEVG